MSAVAAPDDENVVVRCDADGSSLIVTVIEVDRGHAVAIKTGIQRSIRIQAGDEEIAVERRGGGRLRADDDDFAIGLKGCGVERDALGKADTDPSGGSKSGIELAVGGEGDRGNEDERKSGCDPVHVIHG